MGKLERSWMLFKSSFTVVAGNKKLLLFPIVTGFFTILILLFFLTPLAFWNTGHPITDPAHWKAVGSLFGDINEHAHGRHHIQYNAAGYVAIAIVYMVSVFLATFFNVAFFNEILNALNGRPVSIRGGLRFAMSRIEAILMWSLLTGIVGLIIKTLEEKVGFVGRWIVRFIGIAWSVAAVFTIPVIVRDKRNNPVYFLKTSAGLLRKTWGESLAGYVGIQLSSWIVVLASIGLFAVVGALGVMLHSGAVVVIGFAIWFPTMIVFSMLMGVLSQVYRCALFIYATEGVIPAPFDEEQMNMAWKIKSGRSK